jgi:hypothetical protein
MGRVFSKHGEKRNEYRISVGLPEANRLLGRKTRMFEDNIKMDVG